MWERWGTPHNFLLAFIDESDFGKNDKICWRYHHFTHVYQKPQSYEIQFLRYEVRQFFLSFWTIFCPLCPLPLTAQKTNFENFKKASGDAIILNLWNKKHDQMMYAYSDMKCNRHFFCHFRPFFALLPHYWPQKFNLEKM